MTVFRKIVFISIYLICNNLNAQTIFEENFNGINFPSGWTISTRAEKALSIGKNNTGYIRFHPRYQQQYIETPSISLQAGNHLLVFYWNKAGAAGQDSVHIDITQNNGSNWQTIYAIYNANNRTWQTDSVALNNISGNIKFRWNYYSGGIFPAQYFNLDNVIVKTNISTNIKQDSNDITFAVFPNPNNGIFQIKLNNPKLKAGILQITDAKGAIVHQQTIPFITQSLIQLDKSELSKGIYNIQLQTTNEVLSKNIIIQ